MRQTTRVGNAISIDGPLVEEPGLFEGNWYYACVSYGDKQMGLLLETDDEDEAWQEAEDFCDNFNIYAKVIQVQKVVLQ